MASWLCRKLRTTFRLIPGGSGEMVVNVVRLDMIIESDEALTGLGSFDRQCCGFIGCDVM